MTQRIAINEKATPDRQAGADAAADPSAVAKFLRVVGDRVRTARARKGVSRKALSDRSGVSQRYLAQLEAGEGNISISLLRRVAEALDHRIEWFVAEDDPWSSDVVAVTSLYRSASNEQRHRVLEILDPAGAINRAGRVALIGLRGAGKSTLGRMASAALAIPFMELNEDIEQVSGMPVGELMALYGTEGYRRLERQSIERVVATSDKLILAVAGGIVSEPETYSYLLRHYHTIWLRAKPEEHMSRVLAQGDTRPMARNPAAMDELKSILTSRESLYARADAQVNTSARALDESLADLLATIETKGFFRTAMPKGPSGAL
jgi:XRE family aerobic/anaerobic benzoate catabolism transcriptional regulator